MYNPPQPPMNFPRQVSVTNFPDRESAEAFHRKLRIRESGLNADLKENEIVVMEVHTLAGEQIRVRDVGYYRDTDALMFEGFDPDDNLCQIIAKVQGLQVLFRVLTVSEEEPAPRRIGFIVAEDEADS